MSLTASTSIWRALNEYLKAEFGYKSDPLEFCHLRGTLDSKRKKFRLYIRCFPRGKNWPDSSLVVAQIGFRDQRRGHGTRFIRELAQLALSSNTEYIGIEGVNTQSESLARKLHFYEHRPGDWLARVTDLADFFSLNRASD